jgi:hypothetical protein
METDLVSESLRSFRIPDDGQVQKPNNTESVPNSGFIFDMGFSMQRFGFVMQRFQQIHGAFTDGFLIILQVKSFYYDTNTIQNVP